MHLVYLNEKCMLRIRVGQVVFVIVGFARILRVWWSTPQMKSIQLFNCHCLIKVALVHCTILWNINEMSV